MKTRNEYLNEVLNEELGKLYHNATLGGKLSAESDFEADLAQSQIKFECEEAFDLIDQECPEILQYGKVYQYGRGGRTVAPDKLISGGSSWYIRKAEELELSDRDAAKLIRALRSFNESVKSFCETVSDQALEYIREEHAEEISENAGKTRVHFSGVRYE